MYRRDFIRTSALAAGLTTIGLLLTQPAHAEPVQGKFLRIFPAKTGPAFGPFDEVQGETEKPGILVVSDGKGREYQRQPVNGALSFVAAGAAGTHHLLLLDKKDRILDRAAITLATATKISDQSGKAKALLDVLRWTMLSSGESETVRVEGKFYEYFVCWLRDHVHTLKGMKYFYPSLKSGIELYADYQREDGMIWDNLYRRDQEKNWWDKRFRYGDFIRDLDEGRWELKRIPVENDVEYLFIEGIYFTWKATGDTAWMTGLLDKAIKALGYSTSDPYRWSEKYQLLKRGFTIDTWDYQNAEDAARVGGDIMVILPDKTRFGVMFGDNTGFAAACGYLAEMLTVAGRSADAAAFEKLSREIRSRTDALCWTGTHYRHHVPEDTSVVRDLGVDQEQQVSLSNAYSLNRGIDPEKARAIIGSYERIRKQMPASSPGEWYAIYPPFSKGYDTDSVMWEYMNGGVTSIVAGELARGAFFHGKESYGSDILDRVLALARKTGDYLHCAYKGKLSEPPVRTFTPLDLHPAGNVVFPPKAATDDQGWLGQINTPVAMTIPPRVRKSFQDIDFEVLDPDYFTEKTAIALSRLPGQTAVEVAVDKKAASVYLLHTYQGYLAGTVVLHYTDGSHYTDFITQAKFGNWWHTPSEARKPVCKKAWRTTHDGHYVALYAYCLHNPFPEKNIRHIEFRSSGESDRPWHIAAISLSDAPVYFDSGLVSYGIPDNWGAAAVMYALTEGLAGVVDSGVAFDKAHVCPRWAVRGETSATVVVHYPASGGYVAYEYNQNDDGIRLRLTGSMEECRVELPLPGQKRPLSVTVNDKSVDFAVEQPGEWAYVVLDLAFSGLAEVRISFA
jgi:hypothetical protein